MKEALHLQRPLPNGMLTIVARGQKRDGAQWSEVEQCPLIEC